MGIEENRSYRPRTDAGGEWMGPVRPVAIEGEGGGRRRSRKSQSNDSGSLINFIRSNLSCRVIHHGGIWPFVSSIFPQPSSFPPRFTVPALLRFAFRNKASWQSVTVRFSVPRLRYFLSFTNRATRREIDSLFSFFSFRYQRFLFTPCAVGVVSKFSVPRSRATITER